MFVTLIKSPIIPVLLFVSITFFPATTMSSIKTQLGKISADITGDGNEEKVIKVRIQEGNESKIVIEIYKEEKLISEILLPKARDAMFAFKNQRSNLLAADIDGDGIKDILTISRDKDNVSVLSVVTFKNGVFTTTL